MKSCKVFLNGLCHIAMYAIVKRLPKGTVCEVQGVLGCVVYQCVCVFILCTITQKYVRINPFGSLLTIAYSCANVAHLILKNLYGFAIGSQDISSMAHMVWRYQSAQGSQNLNSSFQFLVYKGKLLSYFQLQDRFTYQVIFTLHTDSCCLVFLLSYTLYGYLISILNLSKVFK